MFNLELTKKSVKDSLPKLIKISISCMLLRFCILIKLKYIGEVLAKSKTKCITVM